MSNTIEINASAQGTSSWVATFNDVPTGGTSFQKTFLVSPATGEYPTASPKTIQGNTVDSNKLVYPTTATLKNPPGATTLMVPVMITIGLPTGTTSFGPSMVLTITLDYSSFVPPGPTPTAKASIPTCD